jgi:hypothetical protein
MFKLFKKKWPKEKHWPIEGQDYDFMDVDGATEATCIKILKGKYEGIIYQYGKVSVIEEEEPPRIQFDYFIESEGNFSLEVLKNDKKFITLMGDILVSIFDNNILKKEKELSDETIRTDYSEKFNLQ